LGSSRLYAKALGYLPCRGGAQNGGEFERPCRNCSQTLFAGDASGITNSQIGNKTSKCGGMTDDSSPYQLARLSVSLPAELLEQLDSMVAERGLPSRSQMIAELIRHELAQHSSSVAGSVLAGTITLIYRAERGRVRQALAQTQSDFLQEVISSQHVFLEDDQSLEVLLVQGPSERLAEICDRLRQIRGVHQITLVTTRALLPPLHAHGEGEVHHGQDA
jgi:CopG family nickel-responsive transcriptional regulator